MSWATELFFAHDALCSFLMEILLIALLFLPLITVCGVVIRERDVIQSKVLFAVTGTFIAYLWVWATWVLLVLPASTFVVYSWNPASIPSEAFSGFNFFDLMSFITLNEIYIAAAASLSASWWLWKYFRAEWHRDFMVTESHE